MSGLGALSRMEPAAASFEMRVSGGWLPEITMEVLAGALGHMSVDQAAIARVLVLNDPRELRHVIARVRGMLLTSRLEHDEQKRLANLVVESVIIPNLCGTCEGRAYTGNDREHALKVVCPACGGTGRKVVRGSDFNFWKPAYEDDYQRCRDVLIGWIGGASRIMSNEMEEE